jgi:hypothetical protein
METSVDLGELAAALSQVQGLLRPSGKTSVNPQFNSKYSDLASVWDACREVLTSHGLSVVQTFSGENDPDNKITVETMLLHKSGQYIKSRLALPLQKTTAQGIGSAITYGRRYGLASIIGVTPDDDDDGNAASEPMKPAAPASQRQMPPHTAAKTPPPANSTPSPEVSAAKAAILEYAQAAKMKPADFIKEKVGKRSSDMSDRDWIELAGNLAENDPFVGE